MHVWTADFTCMGLNFFGCSAGMLEATLWNGSFIKKKSSDVGILLGFSFPLMDLSISSYFNRPFCSRKK